MDSRDIPALTLLVLLSIFCSTFSQENGLDEAFAVWSDWGAPSNCSHSCGGGVRYQERVCLNADGSKSGSDCKGPSKIYLSCNVQDCIEPQKDFRLEQCEKYNNVMFDGRTYEWIPYYS